DGVPLPWTNQFAPATGPNYDAVSEYLSGVADYYRNNVGLRYIDGAPHTIATLDDTDVSGCARILWSFLSTFNKVPIVGGRVVTRSHGFVAQDSHHKFLAHRVLTITVPQKAGRKAVRQALATIRRRAHQVRGHWRDDWRLPKGN